ncbi:hypothetical protein ACFVYC_18675 [Pseudarthrobacter sp. NPDC058329]|uniref:hypothetical protein n=1 Tax=Pseudarthrobacter sp. NPDC058329 TaxID=3346448 RepID=UPI0036D8EDDD
MTELSHPDESAEAQPSPDWPDISRTEVTDHLVKQSLTRLDALPRTPVTGHEAAYSELHDELRAALDADPAEHHRALIQNPAGIKNPDGGA